MNKHALFHMGLGVIILGVVMVATTHATNRLVTHVTKNAKRM